MVVSIGPLPGFVIGSNLANSVNRSGTSQIPTTAASNATNKDLPPDHPPIGPGGGQTQGGPQPEVMAAIDKAKQQPQNYEAQMTAADLYYQIQRFDDAAKFYEAASKLKPGETEPMIKAGNPYFDTADPAYENGDAEGATPGFVQAEKWYAQALEKDPKNINVRTDLGLSFFQRTPRDIDRAIKEYKTSLTIDPNHEITLQNLVLAYTEKGDKDNVAKTLEKLKSVNPNNPVITKTQDK